MFNDGDEGSRTLVSDGICRICLQECATRDLISPCSCRGTIAHVHRHCFSDMVSAMKKEKCDICGTHYELQARGLRTWREWKWTQPHGILNTHRVFFAAMFLRCVILLNDLKRFDRDTETYLANSSPGPVLSFFIWLLHGPLCWGLYATLTCLLLYGVKQIYLAAKQWIADNTVYEWMEGGKLKVA